MPQIHFGKSKMGVTNTAMEVQAVLKSWLHLCLCVAETGLVWESLSSLEVEGTGAKQDLQKCLHNDGLGSAALVLLRSGFCPAEEEKELNVCSLVS